MHNNTKNTTSDICPITKPNMDICHSKIMLTVTFDCGTVESGLDFAEHLYTSFMELGAKEVEDVDPSSRSPRMIGFVLTDDGNNVVEMVVEPLSNDNLPKTTTDFDPTDIDTNTSL